VVSGIQPVLPGGPPAVRAANGPAVAAMVLGILAVVFEWFGLVTLTMAITAIVLGAVGINRSAVSGSGRGQGIAGLILGVAGLIAYLAWGIASLGVLLLI
jgi:hypothetical protein